MLEQKHSAIWRYNAWQEIGPVLRCYFSHSGISVSEVWHENKPDDSDWLVLQCRNDDQPTAAVRCLCSASDESLLTTSSWCEGQTRLVANHHNS
jgi:hypothetical protein